MNCCLESHLLLFLIGVFAALLIASSNDILSFTGSSFGNCLSFVVAFFFALAIKLITKFSFTEDYLYFDLLNHHSMDEKLKWVIALSVIAILIVLVITYYVCESLKDKIKDSEKYISLHKDLSNSYALLKSEKEGQKREFDLLTANQIIQLKKNEADLKLASQNWAISEFEKYKTGELEKIRKALEQNALAAAANLLEKWKAENEATIRQDAANRSYAVHMGKITEHLIPFHLHFPFNPKDVRFIGSPIDLIVFDGISAESDNVEIFFVEIKTGKSVLSKRQKQIKSAVQNKSITWHEINIDDL
jgi:predicted Holliday junction resolvase-like endonuclease